MSMQENSGFGPDFYLALNFNQGKCNLLLRRCKYMVTVKYIHAKGISLLNHDIIFVSCKNQNFRPLTYVPNGKVTNCFLLLDGGKEEIMIVNNSLKTIEPTIIDFSNCCDSLNIVFHDKFGRDINNVTLSMVLGFKEINKL
jgi:hypothetical protein